jgi:hypothetical protein
LRLDDLNYLLTVKPTLQRQGCDGLLLNIKQTYALITKSWLNSINSRRSKKNHRNELTPLGASSENGFT